MTDEYEAKQKQVVNLPHDLKMNCSLDPSPNDVNAPGEVLIRAPTKDNANNGLELLLGHQLRVAWKLESGPYSQGTFYSYSTFRYGETIHKVCEPVPVNVTIEFRGHVLFEHRFEPIPAA